MLSDDVAVMDNNNLFIPAAGDEIFYSLLNLIRVTHTPIENPAALPLATALTCPSPLSTLY